MRYEKSISDDLAFLISKVQPCPTSSVLAPLVVAILVVLCEVSTVVYIIVFDTSHANNVSLLSDTATCLCVFMVYLLVLIPADRNFVLFQAAVLSTECILVEL